MATHFDIVVLIAVGFGLIGATLLHLVWKARQIENAAQGAQRLTKAVGTLVIQETGKIRTLLNR